MISGAKTMVIKINWAANVQETIRFPDRVSAGRFIYEVYESVNWLNDEVVHRTDDNISPPTIWVTGRIVKADAKFAVGVELGVSSGSDVTPMLTYEIIE